MYASNILALASWASLAAAGVAPPSPTAPPTGPPAKRQESEVTALTDCHMHGSDLYCVGPEDEYHIQTTPTQTTDIPAEFTGCHAHGSDLYCIDPDGEEVEAVSESGGASDESGHEDHGSHGEGGKEESSASGERNCHFHAGVEHCVGGGGEEEGGEASKCDASPRDYDVGLRVGLLFVILATSALGVFGPILLHRWMPAKLNLIFIILKQFGTGIIISTAFVHLYTHASLMFTNDCVGELQYEGVTSAIVMAGIFLSFMVEYVGQRLVSAKVRSESALTPGERASTFLTSDMVAILVMELGILFHSLLIGLTLVVSGDSFFLTLFVVILFHQVFEGIALGTRIATIGTDHHATTASAAGAVSHDEAHAGSDADKSTAADGSSTQSPVAAPGGLSTKRKLVLASLFAFITPIGMAIGIGVLNQFNGNDKSTLIAIGTLDAFSAGILIWVGVVEMWAGDWMMGHHGHKPELADADLPTVLLGGFGLVSGLILMSLLGKWA